MNDCISYGSINLVRLEDDSTHTHNIHACTRTHIHTHHQALHSKYFQVGQHLNTASQTTAAQGLNKQQTQIIDQHNFNKLPIINTAKQPYSPQLKQPHVTSERVQNTKRHGDIHLHALNNSGVVSSKNYDAGFSKSTNLVRPKLDTNSLENSRRGNMPSDVKKKDNDLPEVPSFKENQLARVQRQQHRTKFNPVKVLPAKPMLSVGTHTLTEITQDKKM